jgi:hypothetical protein
MSAVARATRAQVICPACVPHPGHAPGECEVHCGCKVESRPGLSAFVIRDALGKRTYFQAMTGIGPMFGGTLAQAARFATGSDVAAVVCSSAWPMVALYKVESIPLREPAPFLKWAGGKRQLVPELLKEIPEAFYERGKRGAALHCYYEPFVGSGALFFALRARGWDGSAMLGDANERLVRTYMGVRDEVEQVIRELKKRKYDKGMYMRERARDIDLWDDQEVATWMIYLNKTGFNGLYRVNSSASSTARSSRSGAFSRSAPSTARHRHAGQLARSLSHESLGRSEEGSQGADRALRAHVQARSRSRVPHGAQRRLRLQAGRPRDGR